MIARMAYYSKGRFPPQWIEQMSYSDRIFYMRWLDKTIAEEIREQKKFEASMRRR